MGDLRLILGILKDDFGDFMMILDDFGGFDDDFGAFDVEGDFVGFEGDFGEFSHSKTMIFNSYVSLTEGKHRSGFFDHDLTVM